MSRAGASTRTADIEMSVTVDRGTSIEHPTRARSWWPFVVAAVAVRIRDLGTTLAAFYLIVVVVAGGSATALLVWPASSASYFSWDLGEPATAATIGGLYLASVVAFGVGLLRSRSQVRSLSIGVLALALPTLWFTWTHRGVFDWSRPQAVAWVILFLSAPISIARELRVPVGADPSRRAGRATRTTLALVAVAGAVGAGALWFEPLRSGIAPHSPIPVAGLTGRYLGAWCAFLATTAASAAVRGRTSDARLTSVLLGSVSLGVLAAAARTLGDLGANAAISAGTIAGLGIVAVVLHRANRTIDMEPPT